MGPAHVLGCLAAGSPAVFHGQTKTLQANNARRPTPQIPFLNSGRARGTTRLQVAQPAGELCIQQASSSSSPTVTISREEDALSDAQPASTSKAAGRSVSYDPEEQAGFSGRVATVSFQGRTGRSGSFGLQTDSNRSRLRRRVFSELRMHLDDGQKMLPILLGRRRRIIEEERKKAEDAQRRKMAEARRQQIKDRAAASAAHSNSSSASASTSAPSSPSSVSQAASGTVVPGPKPKGTIPKDAVGNVVAHNLDLKPSKPTKVIPEGFALRIQTGIALPITPNIMVVSGGLGREELEDFASQRVVSSLLTLDVPKELCTVSMASPDTSMFKDSIQYKAAALTRIMKRAAVKHKRSETVVLLQCASATLTPVAQLMAAWLHWHGQMDVQEACDRAGSACGCHISREFIDQATEDLFESASIRLHRNFLVWPHGAFHAQVAGDVVGSWFPATSMRKVTSSDSELWNLNPGDWVLPLPDLEPGVHRYKYVIDDSWRMDWHQPFDHDGRSNHNNLWTVFSHIPSSQYVPEDRMQVIRKEFVSLALRVKMPLGPKMLSK